MAFIGCKFQSNKADGIVLFKVADNTLSLNIIDSYHTIKEYTSKIEGDTLFINVNSIHTPTELETPILIDVEPKVRIVKLQNDKVIDIDSISWYGK